MITKISTFGATKKKIITYCLKQGDKEASKKKHCFCYHQPKFLFVCFKTYDKISKKLSGDRFLHFLNCKHISHSRNIYLD